HALSVLYFPWLTFCATFAMSNISFRGKTVIITGASRGIGKAIGLRLAKDGANIVIAAKTATPHPKLPGTIYTAADEMMKAGGKALACIVDVRDQASIQKCIDETIVKFGGIDILVNNASAIALTNTADTDMKRYDLMHHINTRGTYLFSKLCLPHLRDSAKRGRNPHILNLSPPLSMVPEFFGGHVAYTMAKYGMSMCVLGMAEEFKPDGIAVNAIWPLTMIWTAAADFLQDGLAAGGRGCRRVEIMSDAAHAMMSKPSGSYTGNFAIDEEVLRAEGVKDFEKYSANPGEFLIPDLFIDPEKFDLFNSKM
ncbi:hypothetical protein PENTCL1PPCAC_16415, partial [Pristionchus entomophagus]